MSRRSHATMILVLTGSLLSVASFGLGYVERFTGDPPVITEFFPFFHWRLYGDPKGYDGAETLRIWSFDPAKQDWVRHPVQAANGWSRYAYLQQLGIRVDRVLKGDDGHKLRTFISHVLGAVPAHVKIVRESYYPLSLLTDTTAYDTTHVVHIDRGKVRIR